MFSLHSSAFPTDGPIPPRYTCDGEDLSPPLAWSDAPAGTVTFALIVDDPDAPDPAAPKRLWVHWILYNVPAACAALEEGAGNRAPPAGARQVLTDANTLGYHGPCPPIGKHRYFFHLAALDCTLPDLGRRARRADLERVMTGHVLATAVLMGTYVRALGAAG
jgi:Raf kinase inhibitor-like YbhB/YbcL family protein